MRYHTIFFNSLILVRLMILEHTDNVSVRI